ncbi:MAG: hypothetical protein ACO2PN_10040 [Pyrobaculum sp.]|jgi:hypothetical protein
MDKVEKILEKYKIYLGVNVKVVVKPYKTRTAFTNLAGSPPIIYLNEYLIDDEEIVECNYSCEEKPVGKCSCWLLRPFRHTAGRPLRSVPRGISWQV